MNGIDMKTRYFHILLAICLILLSANGYAQKKNYWVLSKFSIGCDGFSYSRDYEDDSKSGVWEKVRHIDYSEGNMRIGARPIKPEEMEEKIKYYFGWGVSFTETSLTDENRGLSLTWTAPPSQVARDKERNVKMSLNLERGNREDVKVTVMMTRGDNGTYPRPDMPDRHIRAHESYHLEEAGCSVKNKSIWTKDHPLKGPLNHAPNYTLEVTLEITGITDLDRPVRVNYSYRFVPDVYEAVTVADENPGENEGTKFPWWLVPVGVGGVGVAVASKNKNKGRKKKHSGFRMVLYKDFGDTLYMNDAPLMVGARIEETTPDGRVIERPDLTALITVAAEENCTVANIRMQGKYRAADVAALSYADGSTPETATLRFTFNGAGGQFINHVIFSVEDVPEIVHEEALTFPAYSGFSLDMQMGINGFKGQDVLEKSVELSPAAKRIFSASIEQDKEIAGKFLVHVTEIATEPTEEEKKNSGPGDIENFVCSVRILLSDRKDPITTTFDIYRMHLGLHLDVRALKGYLVDQFSTWEKETLVTKAQERKKFGESKLSFKLIVADPETGEIKSVIPDEDPVFSFTDVPEGNLIFMDKDGNTIENPCERMKFQFDFQGVYNDNTAWGVVRSTEGGLYPPNRALALVKMKASWKGQHFEAEQYVPIISQPYVDITDNAEYNRWLKDNTKKYEQLIDLRTKIACDDRFAELMPYYYKVHAMVEGYHPDFGIYEPDYENVMRIYKRYCSGQIGHYFVNNAAWTPAWTAADENLDAFVTTFGSMEKSFTGIAARIALGYFTAGASELVFAPMTGLVAMKKYVDKGGDSAFKGFVAATAEVFFWEGVFYIGGKTIKLVAGSKAGQAVIGKAKEGLQALKESKAGQAVAKKVNSLKDGFKRIKESFQSGKQASDATKKLAGAKGSSTAKLSSKVAESGKKVKQLQASTQTRANEAIKRTRSKGDAIFTKESRLAEEAAKRARQDARKIVDDFQKVMNNPTASPEEMRRATLALQGNKTAQNLLRNHPSDMLRANFNAQMQQLYNELDPAVIKRLEQKMKVIGVKDPKIRVFKGATGNDAAELAAGRKIGADRDVTYQIQGKDGKWYDIREDLMQDAYAEAFNKTQYGFIPKSRQEMIKTLTKADQAVVNGAYGLESYGKDLERIITPGRQAEKLLDPNRISKTFKHKCMEFINQGKASNAQAKQLYDAGLVDEALRVQGYGDALIEEGIRQGTKQFKRIIAPRIQAATANGVKIECSNLLEKVRILESLGNPPPKGALPISLEEARLVLKDQYNCTIEEVLEECANLIPQINNYL